MAEYKTIRIGDAFAQRQRITSPRSAKGLLEIARTKALRAWRKALGRVLSLFVTPAVDLAVGAAL